jgi:hypothetical protein
VISVSCNIAVIKSWRMRSPDHVTQTGEIRNPYTIFVGEPGEKIPPVRPRQRK